MNTFSPGTAGSVASKVELRLSCRGLHDADILSKSDPIVVLYIDHSGTWQEFGRTEVIWDNLNPEFQKKFVMEYRFEIQQKLKFEVYDIGNTDKIPR